MIGRDSAGKFLRGFRHTKASKKKMSRTRKGHLTSSETRQKISESLKREKHPNWKGGRAISTRGYIKILFPEHPYANSRGYVCEHRMVVEVLLNRYLTSKEVVHHINKKINDNRPENLMAFVNDAAHKKFETKKEYKREDVIFDGRFIR